MRAGCACAARRPLRSFGNLAEAGLDACRDLRILLLELPELGAEEHEHPRRSGGGHRRRPPAVAEQRELAEEVSRAEPSTSMPSMLTVAAPSRRT